MQNSTYTTVHSNFLNQKALTNFLHRYGSENGSQCNVKNERFKVHVVSLIDSKESAHSVGVVQQTNPIRLIMSCYLINQSDLLLIG